MFFVYIVLILFFIYGIYLFLKKLKNTYSGEYHLTTGKNVGYNKLREENGNVKITPVIEFRIGSAIHRFNDKNSMYFKILLNKKVSVLYNKENSSDCYVTKNVRGLIISLISVGLIIALYFITKY